MSDKGTLLPLPNTSRSPFCSKENTDKKRQGQRKDKDKEKCKDEDSKYSGSANVPKVAPIVFLYKELNEKVLRIEEKKFTPEIFRRIKRL